MNASVLVTCLGWTLVHFVWQGALIGCAAAVGLLALRHAKPEQRYLLACSALLLCLLWPGFELWRNISQLSTAMADGRQAPRLMLPASAAGGEHWLGYLQGRLIWIVALWAACAAALSVRMALGLLWIGRITERSGSNLDWQARLSHLAAQFGVTRAVRLRVVEHLASPVTAGWWRPVVLVPASLLSGMPAELLEALLAHEMAHVKRFDYLVNLGQHVIETLLFYHPAVWWLSGRIRTEREQIADDLAVMKLGEPRRLAVALSELERFQFARHHLAQAANGGQLMARIKRLMRPDTQALNWKAAVPVFGLAAACFAIYAHAAPAPTPARTPAIADFSSCKKPRWPKEDLAAGHEGKVTLRFLISEDGRVVDSRLQSSSGYPALDQSAREGIAKCRFVPATEDGKPVQAWMQMQYVWLQH
jgi:D-alanyl-D-alanine endopeptidase (penicillin-binding protein 7)